MVSVLPAGMKEGTGLVYLNHSDPMVDITGQLNYAGYYVFVVHYYQPYYPGLYLVSVCVTVCVWVSLRKVYTSTYRQGLYTYL